MNNPTLENMERELTAITAAITYERCRSAEADAHAAILYWSCGYYGRDGAVPVDELKECMTAVRAAVDAWHAAR